jgi:putative tricarboxylic transport membrane protein
MKEEDLDMKHSNLWSSLFWIILAAVTITLASRFSFGNFREPGPGLFPVLIALIILGLGLTLFFSSLFRPEKESNVTARSLGAVSKVVLVLLLLLAYAIFLEKLGFLMVSFLLILLLLWIIYPQRWWIRLAAALGGSLGCYLIFEVWLQSQLPKGFLPF